MIKNATFDHLISFLNKDDALLVLNTLAVFKVLLEFPEGREFLLSSGAVDFSLSSLQDLKANPLHDFLLPGRMVPSYTLLFCFRLFKLSRDYGRERAVYFSLKSYLQRASCYLFGNLSLNFPSNHHYVCNRGRGSNLSNSGWQDSPS